LSDQEPDLNDVFRVALERIQSSIRTAVPATVVSFDRGPRLCSVSVDMLARLRSGDVIALPQIDRVPVQWPAGGGWAMDADLAVGENVLLIVFDRDISGWLPAGAVEAPVRRMMHDISSCVAIPGLRPISRQGKQSVAPGELFIGADSGSPPMLMMRKTPASATLEATTISLGAGATPLQGAARVGDEVIPGETMTTWIAGVTAFINTLASGTLTAPVDFGTILTGSTKTRIE
jgi:hypothetical protein